MNDTSSVDVATAGPQAPNAPEAAPARDRGPGDPVAGDRGAGDPPTGDEIASFTDTFDRIARNVAEVVIGKGDVIRLALLCLVSDGHLLIEDVPGVGKTSLAKALSASIDVRFGRIQFTPDVLPSDVVGVDVWNEQSSTFNFRPGAVFANIVLVDEVNRASPKTQAALLEAMEERQVTTDGVTRALQPPFMVIATQNPIEHEGTYPLPESQMDRFKMRINVGYPDADAAVDILTTRSTTTGVQVPVVATAADLAAMTSAVARVHVSTVLQRYIGAVTAETRRHKGTKLGMSPRAMLDLQRVASAYAAASGRNYVVPDDIGAVAPSVVEHRLLLTTDALLAGVTPAAVLDDVLSTVPVPTAAS